MSRTVHHVSLRHRNHRPAAGSTCGAGLRSGHVLVQLRLTAEESARARREGRRPRPVPVRRAFIARTYPRSLNAEVDGPYESRARAALAVFRTTARNRLRAAPPGALVDVAEDLDHPPTRHRHRNLWEF
ncbi:hypothetical protein ACFYO5_01030 [Streptomyces sp. NPDC006259]|uniref:hypothetical protein n=1 Tax=Streptomyces sp. NPDC006259 TaxID=3364740 RepID=UPI00367553AB